jgi:probable O-glycosylation ligase (exosortase A-associated)
MRDLLLTLLIPAALIWAMTSSRAAILVLTWIGFQRPYDFSWGFWRTMPVWQIAFGIAVLSILFRGDLRPKLPLTLGIFLVLIAWMVITSATAFNPQRSWLFFTQFMVPILFGLALTVAAINDLSLLKAVMWVSAGSLGLNAVKTGLALTLQGGGHLTEQIHGFVGDNNTFALVLCLTVAMLMGLRHTLPDRRWARMLFFGSLLFVVLTIIYTRSRGALLTLGCILAFASLLGGKPIRHLLLLAMVATMGYLALPESNFERLDTLENVQEDSSAMGRVESWKRAISAAERNPLLGIGLGNHLVYHQYHDPEGHVLVAHSTYFQVLGELSFIGICTYVAFILAALGMLWRTWRDMKPVVLKHPDLVWVREVAFWMLCGYIGYLLGSALLNMLLIEYPWYFVILGALLRPMVKRELAAREAGAAQGTGVAA